MKLKNSKLSIKICENDKEWNDFIYKSENKNFLNLSTIVNSSKNLCKKYFIYKVDEIVASFHLYLENNKIISGNQLYIPINYRLNKKLNKSSEYYEKFSITEKYVDFIFENFKKGEITFDYFTEDLRAFLWFNFNSAKEIFKIADIKYTSVINLNNLNKNINFNNLENSEFYKSLSGHTKRQYKNSKKKNFVLKESNDFKDAKLIISKTFERQNKNNQINLDVYEKNFQSFKINNQLRLFYCLNKSKIISFTLFGVVNDTAKYLHGGRLIDDSKDNSLTFNMLSSIINLKQDGINLLDLEGVNSPNRGFWKIGFGGDIRPYYKIEFEKN